MTYFKFYHYNIRMLNLFYHKESLPFLKFDDEFLTEILEHFLGRLFAIDKKNGKKIFICNAMMMYLDKNKTN